MNERCFSLARRLWSGRRVLVSLLVTTLATTACADGALDSGTVLVPADGAGADAAPRGDGTTPRRPDRGWPGVGRVDGGGAGGRDGGGEGGVGGDEGTGGQPPAPVSDADVPRADAMPPQSPGVVRLTGVASTARCAPTPAAEDVTRLVDGDPQTKFLVFGTAAWALFDAGGPSTLSHYALTSANDFPQRDPLRWVLEGSNDARTWVELDVQVDQRFPARFERREFPVDAPRFYRWYRLQMENTGDAVVQLAELELHGTTAFVEPAGAAPGAPGSLRATPLDRTSIELEWNAAPGAPVVYRIDQAVGGAPFSPFAYVPAGVTRFPARGFEAGASAQFRVVAENAAGVSPASAAIMASTRPALVGTPAAGGTRYSEGGYTLTVIDGAPGVTPRRTIALMVDAFFAAYPSMAAEFNPAAPRDVTLEFDPRYDGVAAASGDHIRVSVTYATEQPEDIDLIVHEGFHLVQAYRWDGVPGWATEGLADYVRWRHGRHNRAVCWSLPRHEPAHRYTDGYGVTARFLAWLVAEVAPNLARDLDAALREARYDEGFWRERTGRSLDALWQAYTTDASQAPVTVH